jgi:hypothetical protein
MRTASWFCLAGLAVLILAMAGCTTVTKGTISGVVYEAGSDPHALIQGAVVTATQNGTQVAAMTTLADGKYRLSDLAPGTYAVTVAKAGYEANTISSIRIDFGDNLAGSVKRDVPLTKIRGTISGNVKGQVGASQFDLNGATVMLTGPVTQNAQTATDGTYSFADLNDGTYQVAVTMTGFQPSAAREVTVVNGSEASGINFVLLPSGG